MTNLLALVGVLPVFVLGIRLAHSLYQRSRRQPQVPPTDADIERVARETDRITAIRWYRALHGSRLDLAKGAIDRISSAMESAA